MSVADWRPAGRVCLWRYEPMLRMYSGWHLTADVPGCDSLLDLIGRLAAAGEARHRTLGLVDPRPLGADRIFGPHKVKTRPAAKLRIAFDPDDANGAQRVRGKDERVEFALGRGELEELAAALRDIRRGEADFSIGLGDDPKDPMNRVSFWWWPKAT